MSTTPHYSQFKWTFSTLGCHDLSLEQCCTLAKKYGLGFIEARALEGRIDLPKLFEEQFGTPAALNDYLTKQGIGVSCFDTSLKLVGNTPEDREAFLEFIPWAEATGTALLRVFDGGTPTTELEGEVLEQAKDTLAWWNDLKSSNGWKVDMAIETHDCLTPSPAFATLVEAVGKAPTMIWDTHHTWKKANESISSSWEALGSATASVHIKDSITKPSARHPFTYVQLGTGEFPLNETLETLVAANYQGFVCIEWERMWHPYLTPLDTAFDKAKELNWF